MLTNVSYRRIAIEWNKFPNKLTARTCCIIFNHVTLVRCSLGSKVTAGLHPVKDDKIDFTSLYELYGAIEGN